MIKKVDISLIDHEQMPDLESIMKLRESIKSKGLLHPITVILKLARYKLIAGRKRIIACESLGHTKIDCLIIEDLTKNAAIELSIHENLMRHNLPWYEQVILEKSLHEMRVKEHGEVKFLGRGKGKSGWSLKDTAKELELSDATISEDLRLAEAIETHPDLRKIKDRTTAVKVMRRLAKQQLAEMDSLAPLDFKVNEVLLGDSSELLKYYPDNSFDACITDPPWEKFFKDEELTSDISTRLVFPELFRILKNDSFLYAFVGMEDFIQYRVYLPKIGFTVQEIPLVWKKRNVITYGRRDWEYARDMEFILLAVKGNPALTDSRQSSSVFDYPILHYTKSIHPNEKPVELSP